MTKRPGTEKPPFELIEEAFHLVRLAPAGAIASYLLGTTPFVLALLFFWSDMSKSAFAEERLLPGVLLLTLLFVWMKTWQSIYCRSLLAYRCGETPPRWTLRSLGQVVVFQAAVQPLGLILLPIALIVMLPFGWIYGYFSSATVILGTANDSLRSALARTWRQTMLWSFQNHYVIALLSLFALFVFFNIFTVLLGLPLLAKTLLGIESVFTRSPWAAMNSTLLMTQLVLTYLCLDPVMKAIYVLRCFHGESLQTGEDLRAELNSLRAANPGRPLHEMNDSRGVRLEERKPSLRRGPGVVAAVLFLVAAGLTATGAERPDANSQRPAPIAVPADQLDRSIERTIQKREFSWRLPRDKAQEKKKDDSSFMARVNQHIEDALKAIGRTVEDAVKWIVNKFRFSSPQGSASGAGLASVMEVALILLIALLLGVVVWLLVSVWQRRQPSVELAAEALPAAPDLADENVTAAELPEDGWQRLARELLARGDLRLGLRALYLASLAHLGARRLITLARFKSNHEYERELQRRAHALGSLPQLFADNVTVFEEVWYGCHPPTPEMVDHFSGNLERMKGPA